MSDRRLLLVHAHPDDEATATGATIARYCAEGASVTLVTCTSGELGEVVADDLAHLRGDPDALGEHRRGEIRAALAELGEVRHRWLGGPGRFRDSGMAGADGNGAPGAFAAADPAEVTRAMVEVLRAERPHVVITYDEHGGYGHPDHIAAHRAVMSALDPAADPDHAPELGAAWQVPKVYWTVLPRSILKRVEEAGVEGFEPYTVPDEELTAVLDGRDFHAAKIAALRRYRSQVDLDDGGFFATVVQRPEFAVEHYLLVRGERGPGSGPNGWEDDLFAGLG
ncbi:N-acetyl-1-D-myo-inositol-2-amino-2-deoxy-alpha-D-glucopyranoside deacetylase [Saccharopolyspora hordei]|uniref:1D-myo-inositol 2-acetamido-2-deoxy-alpha-D-glucopyranoside deacetylase n=1 Tax=Saccharopolyspora hordei TaxID=1838 RepID=A0A853ATL6_9PSEU|nr:N-acetyl-1-D-myo-inositol-2-amino-2-deoxy-alpha-D-glucopyranoside deacetylase [Saccharopolyspora hordei]